MKFGHYALATIALAVSLLGAAPASAEPQRVHIGVYLKNVESIDLTSDSYSLAFTYWLRWKGDNDPSESIRLVNLLDEWGLSKTAVHDKPITLADGSKYQRFEVEGKFYHKFWIGTFPLDWQKVTLEIEDTTHGIDELVLVPDVDSSGVDPDLAIPGWDIKEVYNREKTVTYDTNFGTGEDATSLQRSRYRYGLKIQRPAGFFVLKVVPPILITLACCLLVFFVSAAYVDVRFGTPVGALLTEVFLQLSVTGGLPNVGIMLLIDHIFNLSYFVIMLILVATVITTRKNDEAEELEAEIKEADDEDDKAALQKKYDETWQWIATFDRRCRWGLSIFFLLGVVALTVGLRGLDYFS